jgi:putative hemolysin
VLEAIAGQFADVGEDPRAVRREDGSWLLDGQLAMTEIAQYLDLRWPTSPEAEEFETLSGLVLWRLGRIPRTGDCTAWRGWTFEVVDMDGRRIDKVLATRGQ